MFLLIACARMPQGRPRRGRIVAAVMLRWAQRALSGADCKAVCDDRQGFRTRMAMTIS